MKTSLKKYALSLACLIAVCGSAHAVGTITGLVAVPANPVAGESVKYKISTSGAGACGVRVVYAGGSYEPSDNMLINNQPAAGGVMDKTIAKAGTYTVTAMGSPSLNPKCGGEAKITVVIKDKPARAEPAPAAGGGKPAPGTGAGMGALQPQAPVITMGAVTFPEAMTCPTPYTKYTQGVDVSKGEAYCVKTDATCPDTYASNRNPQNGQLTCTPKVPVAAPDGWTHGSGNGELIFNSISQPLVKCPKSTPDWQWGTTYYKEGWNRMGCRANMKPAF
ncbi:hypothetical protein ACEN8I_05680 [Polaromonas sp. CT11-55]|uniref:hypothetical protein n=1 Tax=Polaromonas sp. CT11-55 TaxID=3243045 RepID=UPI0039A66039